MAPIRSLAAAALLLSAANAHFSLVAPAPLEGDSMNEDLQPNGPCGGGVPNLDENTATDFHVGGDAVALLLGHPQASFLVRATLDPGAQGNWTQLFPVFMQSGRGSFCEPAVTAPEEWAGQKGIIGIACAAPDGMLFQVGSSGFQPCAVLTAAVCRRQLCLGDQHVAGLVHQRELRERQLPG
jgi:hypothetical protein